MNVFEAIIRQLFGQARNVRVADDRRNIKYCFIVKTRSS